ncbi:MAG TPA: VOC family protein [Rhizomicrobium sp.]|nr:VOC family protein [Rhizomicrobium sp.]
MSIIKIDDVAYVRFRAPDLGEMRTYLEEFGLAVAASDDNRLFMRGTGTAPFLHATEKGEPGFAAVGFRAKSLGDLHTLAKATDTKVEPLDAPGGGSVVRLTDPDGFTVEVVAGQAMSNAATFDARAPWNHAEDRARFRAVKRVSGGPAHVLRLGHCVLNVSNFRASEAWYKDHLGFLTSDEIAVSPEFSIGAFMRCDRGDQPADHHTLFIIQGPRGKGFNHAAFEVRDLDDLMTGHDHLKSKSRHAEWGIGRHILGSQVFDYWRDPWGHTLEHWTDGDLFTADDPPGKVGLPELLGVQWGPNAPPTMA